MSKLRQRAKETFESPVNVMAHASRGTPNAVATLLPSDRNMRRTVSRIRGKIYPAIPSTTAELVIPADFKITFTAKQFLLHDDGPDSENRMLIFSTADNLQLLRENNEWFVDGTFKTCPPLYEQLYTVHIRKHGKVLPMVFCLLKNKTEISYAELFNRIKILEPGLNPAVVSLDFEKAAINAIIAEFPGAQLQGCFFHFMQSLWRKIQLIPFLRNG